MRHSHFLLVTFCVGSLGLGSCGDDASSTSGDSLSFPASCAEAQENAINETGERPANGTYTLYVANDETKPWNAYCHNMGRAEPVDYLTVSESDNFSEMSGIATTRTNFRRYRIDPVSLEIDPLDDTFALTEGDDSIIPDARSHIPAGWAQFGDGMGVDGGETAQARVDFTDTGFAFADSVAENDFFCTAASGGGDSSASDVTIASNLLSVDFTATNTVPSLWTKTVGACENLSGEDTDAEDFTSAAWPLQYVGE